MTTERTFAVHQIRPTGAYAMQRMTAGAIERSISGWRCETTIHDDAADDVIIGAVWRMTAQERADAGGNRRWGFWFDADAGKDGDA
jgi:hypothetical protein